MDKKSVGLYIREARKRVGLTMVELSNETEISQSYLSSLENGKYKASPEQIIKIANALGIRPSKMLEETGYSEHSKIQLLEETGATVEESLNDVQNLNVMLKMELEKISDIEIYFKGDKTVKTLSTFRNNKFDNSFTFSFIPHFKGITLTDKENKFILSTIEALIAMRKGDDNG